MADSIIGRLVYKIVGDDRDYQKALRRSQQSLDRTGRRMQQIGNRLTLGISVPIAAAGTAAVRAAIDLEESMNAINVVFGESVDQIAEWGETAASAAGLSQAEFNQSAVRIGASLKNAGVPLEELSDQTIALTQRAADMASVFNTDVSDALGAIQSAIRGEGDPIERFGASINAAAVEAKALELGLADTRSEITEQIKVQARLALIMEQTADVAGDFANTSDSAANSSRILKARVTDLAAELGAELLPYLETVLERTLELVDKFGELDDSQKRNIVRAAAFAAAIGPLVTTLGTLTRAAGAARVAFAALAANPVVLAIAALTTGVVALGRALNNAITEQRADDMARFADEAERAGRSASAIAQDWADAEVALSQQIAMGGDLEESVRRVASYHHLALEDVVEIARTLPEIGGEHDDILDTLKEQADEQREIESANEDLSEIYRQQREMVEAINESQQSARDIAIERAAAEQAALEAQREARSEAWQETLADYYQTQIGQLEILESTLRNYQLSIDGVQDNLEVSGESQREIVRTIIAELEEEIQRRREALGLVGETNDRLDGQIEKTERLNQKESDRRDIAADLAKIHGEDLAPTISSILQDAEDFTDVYADLADQAGAAWAGVFEGLGEAIVNTEDGLQAVGATLVTMFTGILQTMGAQFAAMAAGAMFGMPPTFIPNPAQAAAYGAASAGFYTASGLVSAISAFANGGSFIADKPTLALFGEAGPETVDIQPVPKVGAPGAYAGGGGITINGDVYGYDDFAQKVEEAQSRSSRLGRTGR